MIPCRTRTRVALSTIRKRIRALRLGGPLFATIFVLVWIPWLPSVELQFVVCIVLYDGFLTYVELNQQVLMINVYSSLQL